MSTRTISMALSLVASLALATACGSGDTKQAAAKDRQEAANVGKGQAWIATNGRTIKGTWRKASPTAPTLLFDGDDNRVTLTAGQTFVQVIPLTYEFKIDDGELPIVVPNGVEDPG